MHDFLSSRAAEMDLQRENDSEPNAAEDPRRQQREDLPSPPDRLIAGILGVICLILMYTVLRMVHFIPCTIELERSNLSALTMLEKGYHCGQCPPEWLIYSNNCYYISTEQKTWNESLMACASQNSSLLYIDDKEEMSFMHIFNTLIWIGVSPKNNNNSCLWKNGSVFFSKIFSKTSELDKSCVLGNFKGQKLHMESCLEEKRYVCKRQALWLT
ncbi:NKG2-A/NKG2-B type II integral membrane protein-like isoform X1 [Artibeus jamaicensis]|uniref:NKG2-A/NKG2-B type II integral membrane protein-like isoform X1 n=1 Tax=Artibeus jamaicensis TaxID=9417 RepID=UPI00235AB9F9|nr:NKG2-A/NKG2-B type II integral membrane protein-like isoform X1 [Artibeus jamaicensis]